MTISSVLSLPADPNAVQREELAAIMLAMAARLRDELRLTRPLSSREEGAFLGILRTADALTARLGGLLRETAGLSPPQYNVLRILRGAGDDGLNCGEIGGRMIGREPDVTRLLDRLEKRGLVRRERKSADRRVILASILPAGLELLARLDEPIRDLHRQALGPLGERNLGSLIRLLERVREAGGASERSAGAPG